MSFLVERYLAGKKVKNGDMIVRLCLAVSRRCRRGHLLVT
jgi:hypothetical protein